ncbi:MAG TPA: hypothetical protein VK586_06700 [Streptosporangiaceae bacterium]|nr:hypothetical protein [Streptosporangiaceae bacterium]
MELSPTQRKLTFALVVLALVALGVYLFVSRGSGPAPAARASHPARPAAPARPAVSAPPATASAPAGSAVTQNSDIFQLVPFTAAGLASGEKIADQFGAAYGTYSYTETAAAYVRSMQKLVSPQLSQQIAEAYSTPGVAGQRTGQRQVAAATAQVTSLRAFGPNSLTFIITVTQQVTATKGGGTRTAGYAVTLTGGDTTWQVTDIELQNAGQF